MPKESLWASSMKGVFECSLTAKSSINEDKEISNIEANVKTEKLAFLPDIPEWFFRKVRWCTLGYQYDWNKLEYIIPDDKEEILRVPLPLESLTANICMWLQGVQLNTKEDTRGTYASENSTCNSVCIDESSTSHMKLKDLRLFAPAKCAVFYPDAAVVNYYQLSDTLTCHVIRIAILFQITYL